MGHQSASTVVGALSARSAVDQESVSTVVSALDARSAVGHKYASMVIGAIDARSVKTHTCNTTSLNQNIHYSPPSSRQNIAVTAT